ncbi:hypothetical protein ACS126_03375 [Sphingobacterium lactis]|uniref:hypothetical protein n=1 Tax=Sphingobacterium TaxID=28453 RepID=UPI0021A3B102|nr:hypothetical protein [Sphingobacterium hotanense]MCT1525806.1 hypothetical protein [Sphingobacterium hotanense]
MLETLKCYIIEDEPLAAEQLQSYICEHNDLMFLGHISYIGDPDDFIEEVRKADILFLDIQVPGGNIEQLKKELLPVPFIVVTSALSPSSYPNFITEREHFLLRKPTTPEVFEKCIQQIMEKVHLDI